jgi:NitT/TauT family transport system ATP-binding protein
MNQAIFPAVSDSVLSARDVGVRYASRRGPIDALAGVDLGIGRGEFVSILGPSGCGKSTLLKLVAGLLPASHGELLLDGKPIRGPRRETGVVFQKPNLLPWKSVRANVLLPAQTLGLDKAASAARAEQVLKLVGLAAFADNYPGELSGGMQQRVGIARMLLHDPQLLLMDEPFAALDAMTREQLMLELQRIWQDQAKSVLFITHSIAEAVFLSDRVLVMSPRPGRIVENLVIDLPRPRTLDTLAAPRFIELSQHLRRYFSQ